MTGAANPTMCHLTADNWNIALSTMALMAYLDGTDRQSALFANQPEVKAALDTVFIAGDYNGDGVVNGADYDYWRSTYGSLNSLAADGNNDGIVDMADYVVWRDHAGGRGGGIESHCARAWPHNTGRFRGRDDIIWISAHTKTGWSRGIWRLDKSGQKTALKALATVVERA